MEEEKKGERSLDLLDDLEDLVRHDLKAGGALGEDVDLRVDVATAIDVCRPSSARIEVSYPFRL